MLDKTQAELVERAQKHIRAADSTLDSVPALTRTNLENAVFMLEAARDLLETVAKTA